VQKVRPLLQWPAVQRLCLALVLVFGTAVPDRAAAHGRFPETHGVTFHPSNPAVIVTASTFGPVMSTDGGETWRWSCEAALMLNPLEDPSYVLMNDGSLLASGFGGLQRGTPSLCLFREPDTDVGFAITDVARSPNEPQVAFAPTSAGGGVSNRIFRTSDGGESWDPTSEPIEPILFESLIVGPGDELYLSGIYPVTAERREPEPFVHRSTDAGATWERFPFAPFAADDRTFLLLAVDPADPDHLFAHVLPDFNADRAERLVRSIDGGESWTVVGEHRRLGDVLFAPDGTIFLGTEKVARPTDPTMPPEAFPHGLYRSDDGGETFETVREDLDVGCLGWHEGRLWACADNYQDGFLLGVSDDQGESFEPRLVLREMLGPVECDPSESTPVACEERDEDIIRDFEVGIPAPDGDGGGCATGGEGPAGATLLLVALALTIRQRSL